MCAELKPFYTSYLRIYSALLFQDRLRLQEYHLTYYHTMVVCDAPSSDVCREVHAHYAECNRCETLKVKSSLRHKPDSC